MPPSASVAALTKAEPPAVVLTSHTSAMAPRPMRAAASSIRARSRPQIATRAPSAARASAAAYPRPADAAATAARLPVSPRSMPAPLLTGVRTYAARSMSAVSPPPSRPADAVADVATVSAALAAHDYLPDEGLATAIFLALRLHRPAAARGRGGRRQDRGGQGAGPLDGRRAHPPPVLRGHRRRRRRSTSGTTPASSCTCGPPRRPARWAPRRPRPSRTSSTPSGSSCERPLLQAIDHREGPPPVLLIDEVDRADDEFEAFLLEVLSDYAVTVPELGTFRAAVPPIVVITSNRTRDVHDALKRRCLYHWVEHPDFEREVAIVRLRAPEVGRAAGPPGGGRRRGAARARALQAAGRRRDDRLGAVAGRARAAPELERGHGRRPRSAPSSSTARTRSGSAPRRRRPRARGRRARAGAVTRRIAVDAAVVAFARVLRGAGLEVPGRATCSRSPRRCRLVGVDERDGVYWAGRATLVHRPEDIAVYDRAFAAFWERHGARTRPSRAGDAQVTIAARRRTSTRTTGGRRRRDSRATTRHPRALQRAPRCCGTRTSPRYTAAELDEARRLMADLRLAGALRRSRRRMPARDATGAGPTCAARCAPRCGPEASPCAGATSNRRTRPGGSCCCST